MKPYSEEERQKLKEKYTAEQMAAIDVGEEAVDPEDLYDQGSVRNDPMSLKYLDDFSTLRPYIDNPPKPAEEHYDPSMKERSDDELAEDLLNWVEEQPSDASSIEFRTYIDNARVSTGKPEAEREATDYRQAQLPKLIDPLVRRTVRAGHTDAGSEQAQFFTQLAKQTGMRVSVLKSLRVKILVSHRVSNQTRMGKIHKQYYLMVAGNKKGLLGIGEGSAAETQHAMNKARRNAIRSMVPIPRYENRTIYGDVKGKVGATELELFTRPPGEHLPSRHARNLPLTENSGFGIRCQEKILEMCKCAGISDISARVTRARNPMNTVKAAFQALLKQRDPEQVARARGRKMVDVRKVYYAGQTAAP